MKKVVLIAALISIIGASCEKLVEDNKKEEPKPLTVWFKVTFDNGVGTASTEPLRTNFK